MRIVKLQAENVKKLRCVEVSPDGSLFIVGGKNGNGKTSLLDSIMMALAGKQAIPPKPVRTGQEKASITVELDEDFVIRRVIKPDGDSTVEVRTKAGLKYPSPQALLDGFSAKFTFDPLRFRSMRPSEQAEILKQVLGLDFTEIDRKRKTFYEDRTNINRAVRDLESQVAASPRHDGLPSDEISISDLAAAIADAGCLRNRKDSLQSKVDALLDTSLNCDTEIVSLEKKIKALKVRREDANREANKLAREMEAIEVPDVSAIQTKVREAGETNRKVRENKSRFALVAKLTHQKQLAETLTKSIEDLDASKAAQLAGSTFPIAGLSVGDDGVTLDGTPFEQMSAAEQLRISVAIGIAMNPKLKVLLIRDGSALDEDNLRLVAELAEEHGAQVWLERVGEGEEISVVLEDGSVKKAPETVEAQ